MHAISQNWLLVIAAVAGFVILSSRGAAVVDWVKKTFGRATPTGELAIVVNLVAAAKYIADPEQRAKVRDACVCCFNGWLKKEIPE